MKDWAQDSTQVKASPLPQAQAAKRTRSFKPFSIVLGYQSMPEENPLRIGLQYAVNDKIGVRLRYDYYEHEERVDYTFTRVDGVSEEYRGYHRISLHGDYFFVNSPPWRLSAGLGLGYYSQKSLSALKITSDVLEGFAEGDDPEDIAFSSVSTLGFAPRMRVQLSALELGFAYHYTFAPEVYDFFALYLGIELGGREY